MIIISHHCVTNIIFASKTQNNIIMEDLPQYIEGIPTNKHRVKERFELVMSYYEKLWIKLQRESRSNYIRNEFLDAQIFIVKNESDKKTAREELTIGVLTNMKHIQYSVK